ncbi:lycopene cyclase domain-containing protein [Propionibacterium cyclohexanicum]|uniref:Lycopene cyclase domain-containing protein n=1 Tax=Propionibacterium cyclohexanicum TaxID=64702 RepID=A0A1H9TJ63_9ACTN|nr:lycopene cyclase domain-containing protein [Propionibacterium cyclohexanicum]SER97380.1 lycopene cyclase domain-containing protein [Propionibacterium cyclohexanicum]
MSVLYLVALSSALCAMLALDARYRLFFWRDPRAASIVTAAGLAFFLAWDAAGIALGIFARGDAEIATGVVLAPELPLEEPLFLVFLVVCTMVVHNGAERLLEARRARADRRGTTRTSVGEEPRS